MTFELAFVIIIHGAGEIPKRLKGRAWKARRHLTVCEGSNPSFSASEKMRTDEVRFYFFSICQNSTLALKYGSAHDKRKRKRLPDSNQRTSCNKVKAGGTKDEKQ